MKGLKKLAGFVIAFVLCANMLAFPVFAETSSQDGLTVSLTTDKSEYKQNEKITVNFSVKNENDFAVNNVIMKTSAPDGYKLDESLNSTKEIDILNAGETAEIEAIFVTKNFVDNSNNGTEGSSKEKSDDSEAELVGVYKVDDESKESLSTSPMDTGDNSSAILWMIILVLATIVLIILGIVKRDKEKKMLSLLLGVAMVATLAGGKDIPTKAAELQNKSISVTENITVEKTDLLITASVKYDINSELNEGLKELTKPENPSEADEYYWSNSKVFKVLNAKESESVLSETQAKTMLKERGFVDYPITYEYSIDGVYNDETEISDDSTVKHPMYQTFYVTGNGEVWTIIVINGTIFANPVSFNLESDLEAQLLISESEKLTSYDDETNKFYVTIPNESAVIVKTVDKIDAETLDSLTIEEISKL